MDFDLPRDVRLVRRSVREFADGAVAPLVQQMEQRDEFPASLVRALGELGVLGLVTPAEHGGSNLGHLARMVAVEEVSRVSAAVGISLQVHHMAASAIADFGSEAQKAKYLPPICRGDFLGTCAITEPTGGSDLLGMASTARPVGEIGRPGMAATSLGILQACHDESVRFAKERQLYGRPIAQLQAIQWGVAEIFAQLQASRWLCYHAAWLKDAGRDCGVEMTLAKMYVSEAAVEAAKKAIEIHGACGTMMEYAVQRLFRDAMVCVSAGGTTEIGKLVVARAALA